MSTEARGIEQLLQLMARLRDPVDGCPWDQKQTFASIVPHTLEEAYEVADAIEREDWPHVREELGDLLFQVVYYAQMGREQALFDFDAIAQGMVTKLLRRHPHVFPEGTLESRPDPYNPLSEAEIKASWERIKADERREKAVRESRQERWLDAVPATLPAVRRGQKLQKRAAQVGFDWDDAAGALAKVREELDELEAVLDDRAAATDELGDLLFSCINLARKIGVDADAALRQSNQKFYRRFNAIEARLGGIAGLKAASLAEMDALWDEAKQQES